MIELWETRGQERLVAGEAEAGRVSCALLMMDSLPLELCAALGFFVLCKA